MESSLIKWINSFENLTKKCSKLDDLVDGIILNDICCQIAPSYFKSNSLRSSEDVEDNWVLKSENIKNLLNGIDQFFKDLGISCGVDSIQIDEITTNNSSEEITKLIELILGILLECEHNNEYITNIMELDEESQNDLMVVLERIKSMHQHQLVGHSRSMSFSEPPQLNSSNNSNNNNSNSNNNNRELIQQIEQLKKEKETIQLEFDEVKLELNLTMEQRNKLSDEKTKIQEVCNDLQGSFEQLQKQFDEAKQQSSMNVMTDEKIKEDINSLHVQIEAKEKQLQEQKKRLDEVPKLINENRSLRDEIDILKEKSVAFDLLEKKMKIYEKKLDEVNDLKKKIKDLEEQNQNYLQQTLDLEEELTKSTSIKSQAETNKQALSSLKIENTKLELSLKSLQEERDKLNNQVSAFDLERDSMQSQITSLRSNLTSIQQENESKLLEMQSSMSLGGGLGDVVTDQQTNERIVRLERENKRLKESVQKIPELENQLEEFNGIRDDLLAKIKHLEENPTTSAASGNSDEVDKLKLQLQEHQQKLQESNLAMDELKKELVELDQKHKESTQSAVVQPKTESQEVSTLKSENEKLQGYLRAAKDMIKKLREKLKDNQSNELQISEKDEYILKLQNQIKTKTEYSEELYKQLKESKEEANRELNLMLSAVLRVGMEMEQVKNQNSKEPRSFLNKKRDP
ncbi:hook family protein [Tieghemostelium lacteum]|uniref:Hook family protein n=1 Tax=Tieghemostelium lacteum TaxID=361077 RepID=A0A152A7T3_TIELA|nr:hook family protein [Tieghemostelium lacteum]|eukprot:KYR02254.1 hook family protein [Tieghemostelium lacteum]